jgi:hypothetical protein
LPFAIILATKTAGVFSCRGNFGCFTKGRIEFVKSKHFMRNPILALARTAFIFVAVLALSTSCHAQDARTNVPPPSFPGQAPGEGQRVFRMVKGAVTAVDSKAMTVTIKSEAGVQTFKATAKTKFTHADAAASWSDVAAGKMVEATVVSSHGHSGDAAAQPDELVTLKIKDS